MIFELMSRGNITELPSEGARSVTLLMPHGRVLKGTIADGTEFWSISKQSDENSGEEIFLYDGQPKTFNLDQGRKVTISSEVVAQLRAALFSQTDPPGEHSIAATVVRSITSDVGILNDNSFVFDEESAIEKLRRNKEAAAAYWGIRFALSRGEHDVVSRIKLWYRIAPDTAFTEPSIKVWFSLTQMPDGDMLSDIIELGFSREDVQRVAAQGTSPVVLYSRGGYLLLASYGDGGNIPLFREWAYFPPNIWNELRERRRVTLRELLLLAWGANDARNALEQSAIYGFR